MNTDTDKKYLNHFYELPQLKTISCNRLQAKLEPQRFLQKEFRQ